MNDKASNDLISVGMDLGIFTIAKLINEGVELTPKAWYMLGQHASKSIEEKSGMPAEDLAMRVQPVIDAMLAKIK